MVRGLVAVAEADGLPNERRFAREIATKKRAKLRNFYGCPPLRLVAVLLLFDLLARISKRVQGRLLTLFRFEYGSPKPRMSS